MSIAWSKNVLKDSGTKDFLQSDDMLLGKVIRKVIASWSLHRSMCSNVSGCNRQWWHVVSCQCCPPCLAILAGVANWL